MKHFSYKNIKWFFVSSTYLSVAAIGLSLWTGVGAENASNAQSIANKGDLLKAMVMDAMHNGSDPVAVDKTAKAGCPVHVHYNEKPLIMEIKGSDVASPIILNPEGMKNDVHTAQPVVLPIVDQAGQIAAGLLPAAPCATQQPTAPCPLDKVCDICRQIDQETEGVLTQTATFTETIPGQSVLLRDPLIYQVIQTVSCVSSSTATSPVETVYADGSKGYHKRIVPVPRNFRELQNAINSANLPEDVRSLLKALAIIDQDYVQDHMNKKIRDLIEEDARNNPPYESVTHIYPVGFDNSVPVGIMYYSNIFYICKDMPNDLKDLKY